MKHFYVCLAVLVTCILTACSEGEVAPEILPGAGSEIYFEDAMNFGSDGGNKSLHFSTNKDWTIYVANTVNGSRWCTVSQTSGQAGDISVQVYVEANEGYDDRNVVLTIQVGELMKTVVVTQKQKDALTLTTDRFEVGQEGGTIHVEVKSNISYEVVIPDEYKGWISQKDAGRGLSSSILSFEIAASEEYEKREGKIMIHGGAVTEVINVYQTGGGIILLTESDVCVSDRGEIVAVEIKSNCEFEVKMPDVDWITVANARSVSSHTLYYTVSPNETYDGREAEIVFLDKKNSNVSDTLCIRQVQKDAILLSENEYSISADGGTLDIVLQTNIEYSYSVSEIASDWIVANQSRALNVKILSFSIKENATGYNREGTIVFNGISSGVSEIVTIKQMQSNVLVVNQKEYRIGSQGGLVNIDVQVNRIPETSLSETWASVSNIVTYDKNNKRIIVGIDPNISFQKRTVILSLKNKNLTAEVVIAQNGSNANDDIWNGDIATMAYAEGKGTEDNPYLITQCSQMAKLAQDVNSGKTYKGCYFKLLANLNFNNLVYTPIGQEGRAFSANWDGNGKMIIGLNISQDKNVGLFGYIDGSTIKGVSVSQSTIIGKEKIGGIVGYAKSSRIYNCSNEVELISGSHVGGIAGCIDASKIFNCCNRGKLSGDDCVGGIVGRNGEGSEIWNSYNKGSIREVWSSSGGIVGYNCGEIVNCYNSGTIKLSNLNPPFLTVGGIAGYNHTGTYIVYCYYLKQAPVNMEINLVGDLDWGTCIDCCTFNGSGELSETILCDGGQYASILKDALNYFILVHEDEDYNYWRTDMAWPDFVSEK